MAGLEEVEAQLSDFDDIGWQEELEKLFELYGSVPSLVRRHRKSVKKKEANRSARERALHRIESLSRLLHEEDCKRSPDELQLLEVPLIGCGSYPPTLYLPTPKCALKTRTRLYGREEERKGSQRRQIDTKKEGRERESEERGGEEKREEEPEGEEAKRSAEEQLHRAVEESCVGRGRARGCVPAFYIPTVNVMVCRSAALVQKPELFLRRVTGARVSQTKLQKEREPMIVSESSMDHSQREKRRSGSEGENAREERKRENSEGKLEEHVCDWVTESMCL